MVVQDHHRPRHRHQRALLVLQAGLRITPLPRALRHLSRMHLVATRLLGATRRLVGDMRLTIRRHLLRFRATIPLVVMLPVIHLHLRVVLVFPDLLLMVRHLDLHQVFLHPLDLRLGKEDILHQVDIISSTDGKHGRPR